MVKILDYEIQAPEPEELSFENEDGTHKNLCDREVSKIASKEWKKKTSDLAAFLKSYTKKVNSYRKNNLLPTFRTYKPKKVRPSKRALKTAVSSKQIISVDMFLNGIPPTPMQSAVPNQAFNMIEGNSNVVCDDKLSDYKEFEEFIDVERIYGKN
ncbi:8259_t:CDS:2 [Racocetra persica]|uniref:8259_t:CDS:1 n=1 Tax=Racocetra persica TaxID=160502 RepID=A0ACA9Q6V4_9GLOM|nr:8259_t:CDS:2 [Racocetra persica]